MTAAYRPRRVNCRNGRAVTMRAIAESDAPKILQAFDRLSAQSRYSRFMQHKKHISADVLERGVRPQPGRDFAFVATIPAADGFDIVGAAQYVHAGEDSARTCEFAITLADDWHGSGLARTLLASLVRRARRDGYKTMEGWVIADNAPMIALARKLHFTVESVPGDFAMVHLQRAL
jgi:RimJ/RimL family protein N-acetyltransferase